MRRTVAAVLLGCLLGAVGLAVVGSGRSDEPSATTTTTPPGPVPADLQFRPVLGETACSDPTNTPPVPAGSSLPAGPIIPDLAGDRCFTVGPAGLDGTSFSRAQASPTSDPANWQVTVRVADLNRGRANALFNACFERRPTCPPGVPERRGVLAIVLDGRVIAAPEVIAADLADRDLQISGRFSETAARELAAVLQEG